LQALTRQLATAPRRPWPDRPVPITLVITDLDLGGAERALVALATGLDRRRWTPSVVALGPEGRLVEPLRAAKIATICLDVDRRRPLRAVARLAGVLRAQRPRLIQSFLFHANIAARLAAPLARVPWVVSGLRVAERQKRWHLVLDRLTARLAAGSVCVSSGVLRYTRDVGRWPAERLTMIPNAVDPGPIDRAEPLAREVLGIPDNAHLALFVGRLEVQKGVMHLLEAAERIVAARSDWHLALVGGGPEGPPLRSWASSRPMLAGHVHWLGPRDDVPALLKTADLFVLPSLWEGMPNVVLEAMAARRAVVATAVEGTEDLVIAGQTGWLVPPKDPAALAAALLDAAADPARLVRFGAAGRQRVEAEFTPGGMVAAYSRLWAGLLGLAEP
jgi:glycosyltransferase involved in cell wall biosynthesis